MNENYIIEFSVDASPLIKKIQRLQEMLRSGDTNLIEQVKKNLLCLTIKTRLLQKKNRYIILIDAEEV